jgi:hypothetical protein
MSQVDPWKKAADCERALRITVDPIRREILSNIREFWIALADERPFLSEEDFAADRSDQRLPRHARPQQPRLAHIPVKACRALNGVPQQYLAHLVNCITSTPQENVRHPFANAQCKQMGVADALRIHRTCQRRRDWPALVGGRYIQAGASG